MERLKELLAKQADGSLTTEEQTELAELEAKVETETEVEVSPEVEKALANRVKGMVEDAVAKATEGMVKKDVLGGRSANGTTDEVAKEVKLLTFLKSLNGDMEARAQYKAMTEGTDSAGGYLVPPADFIAELRRLEEQYGVAARNCNVRRVNSDSYTSRKKSGEGVVVYEVGELATGTESQLEIAEVSATLRKFMGLTVVSSELNEDSAIDIWNELTRDFARAFAKKQDQIVFTDTSTGITKISGTNVIRTTASGGDAPFEDVTFDDLIDATVGVPTDSMNNGKFYMHRTVVAILQKIKDSNNNYIWQPGPNGMKDGTIWGFPYEMVEVLPSNTTADPLDTGFIVFGDLRYYDLIMKNSMRVEMLREGTIGSVNLSEDDGLGLRAVQRMEGEAVFPAAFSVIKTPTSS